MDKLSYHGRTLESCKWVLDNFAGREYYRENDSVQEWIAESKQWLAKAAEDKEFELALESKFGKV